MSTFWSVHHGGGSSSGGGDAADARRAAQQAQMKVVELESRCDKALLVCEALWTIMRDKMGVSEQELVDRVNEIDLSDGQLDGKVRRVSGLCPNCNRTVSSRFSKCMYCGQPIARDTFGT